MVAKGPTVVADNVSIPLNCHTAYHHGAIKRVAHTLASLHANSLAALHRRRHGAVRNQTAESSSPSIRSSGMPPAKRHPPCARRDGFRLCHYWHQVGYLRSVEHGPMPGIQIVVSQEGHAQGPILTAGC